MMEIVEAEIEESGEAPVTMRLDGKVALVTGAGSPDGIGYATGSGRSRRSRRPSPKTGPASGLFATTEPPAGRGRSRRSTQGRK